MSYLISIDPSINKVGFAVFHGQALIEYGTFRTQRGDKSDRARLRKVFYLVHDLCRDWSPEVAVIEDWGWRRSDVRTNKKNLKRLIWAIGCCVAAIPDEVQVKTYIPIEWKKNVKKEVIISRAKIVYRIKESLDDNAADAIMLGHFYIQNQKQLKMEV